MTDKNSRKYAVVDLEATSGSASAMIIQVGIVIIKNDRIVETYQTDVNPHEALTEHIVALTGITDEQLAQAPDFSQVAAAIYNLIKDCVFVAHNVKFDANLLAEHLFLEGFDLRTPRVDTVELTQVFYPHFEKYSLVSLAAELQLDLSEAHTAIADALATAQLFLKLKKKIEGLPKEALEKLLPLADNLLFESRMLLDEALIKAPLLSQKEYTEVGQLILKKSLPLPKKRKLSQDFTVNLALLGLEAREKQKAFAQLVETGLSDQSPSFLEAQAGLGKTYAYLLPLLSKSSDRQLIVSVPTKVLQDQIMANEVKKIKDVFHLPCHSIKGPRNYIKLDAFAESLNHESSNRLINRYKMQILVWLLETETGDLDEIKQKQRFESYFDSLRHDGKLRKQSQYFPVDFWRQSYENAKSSQLLLTNHAYFLERVQDDKAFAEKKVLVFDEAQKLLLNLEQFSRRSLNLSQLLPLVQHWSKDSQQLIEKRLLESLSFHLDYIMEQFHQTKDGHLDLTAVNQLQQNLSELNRAELQPLKEMITGSFTEFWLSSEINQEKRQMYLNAGREDFLNFKSFLPELKKLYFISATLDISPKVSLPGLLGFTDVDFARLPKTKNSSQRIWLDRTMPIITQLSAADYAQELTGRLFQLLTLKKPILVLFTSIQSMLMVSEELEKAGILHLTQEKNGTASKVKQKFEAGDSQLLLGTGSFWEGADFVAADRMIEVITRLPFDNPEDFFVKKMNKRLKKEGKHPFYDYSLPLMILRLKQAIGRTLRRSSQRSAVLIMDSRILNKTYSPVIYHALDEEFYLSNQKFADCLAEIEDFLI
ncbi:bifunctional DnaQ family exonuclease/ATP-dependent helicase [Streptococcus chenjunshii]|uniref:3'-5' exonuclease DinG n=1 Tax=Streptococcus chenjunshii TaxID=2173853 RepID=A0A372KMZ4_9STRE|nr:bifunctional DnaQ family exonuclease/ATP-dependent helicase [Streptococcus chenjunshii]AXQ79022.1 bifunctional DnaQ family exonuclease/ATP-dependent helicase [Streptococcus chenjunshii]RFU51454.1 bifunctional DnaQ family exonuclease/ATP-dependent helicase [Streptococcus chenjunshii]RFU53649.1 bifunctional DnaQ family exonuclease/ATP-dependent helicase [Streptococcus chenjunshii]